MLKPDATNDEIPVCFGTKHYDNRAAECVGGQDPAYNKNGSHIRPPCDYVSACSARHQAKFGNLVPTQSLIRPAAYAPPAPAATPYRHTYQQPVLHHQQQPPHNAPQSIAVNYFMPQYLSVREPANGRSLGKRLFTEAVRSIGKSLGHTIAHFFDVEIFGNAPKNNEPPTQQ